MAYVSQKISNKPLTTKKLGLYLGQKIPQGAILALTGDLGGGKTCFTQGLAAGLGIIKPILSPTFVIYKVFPLKKRGYHNLFHLDFYRLKRSQIDKMAFFEMLNDKNSIMVIEWADKVKSWLPLSRTIFLDFVYLDKYRRRIKIKTQSRTLDKILKMVYNKD